MIDKIFGLEPSQNIHEAKAWKYAGAVPGLNTVSGIARLALAVSLVALNAIGCGVFALMTILTCCTPPISSSYAYLTQSCFNGVALNGAMLFYSIFEAIPIVGCLPVWCQWKTVEKVSQSF